MKADARVIEKIQKLLAFANDTRGNTHEVARAAAQVEAMLRKYNLEMTDVIMAELKDDEDAVTTADVFLRYRAGKRYRKVPDWAQWLATALTELFDCHCNMRAARNSDGLPELCLRFYGYHTDLTVCTWMMDYLSNEVYRAATNHHDIRGQKATTDFREGASSMICRRLKQLKLDRDKAYAATSTGTSLVVYKRQAIEAKFGDFGYRQHKRDKAIDYAAYRAGAQAGEKINLTPGTPIASTETDVPRLA